MSIDSDNMFIIKLSEKRNLWMREKGLYDGVERKMKVGKWCNYITISKKREILWKKI